MTYLYLKKIQIFLKITTNELRQEEHVEHSGGQWGRRHGHAVTTEAPRELYIPPATLAGSR